MKMKMETKQLTIDDIDVPSNENYTISTAVSKAERLILRYGTPMCSISGGSDSDIMLDMIHSVDHSGKVTYYFIDTGLEYQATKDHLEYLEKRYDIKIECFNAIKPIPTCVKEYGVPFISKQASEFIERLQKNDFQWEDAPLEELLKKYPKCKSALQWWCNERITKDGKQKISHFSISRNKYLKEFLMSTPPEFRISAKCCDYAKKKAAKKALLSRYADLDMVGVRKSEGGVRSISYENCYTNKDDKEDECSSFRPVFWFNDSDKREYEQVHNIVHSKCYTEYGLKRTGCTGCPYNIHITEELAVIEKYEPKLYKAAVAVFGKSYEYTRKYREFVKEMKAKEGIDENQIELE